MNLQKSALACFIVVGLSCIAVNGFAQHGDHQCDGELEPVLDTPDYNGDGTVDGQDVSLVANAVDAGEYIAFYDHNADEKLDGRDVRATARQTGETSSTIDQQIADVFWATNAYRDQRNAMAAGFIPFTEDFYGHGVHWAMPYDGRFDMTFEHDVPEGLNYTSSGELVAVFYFHGSHYSSAEPPPEGFATHEDHWHNHVGACFGGLDYANPTYTPSDLDFDQCTTPQQCYADNGSTDTIWSPKFHMLHLWLYKLNPCGRFAGTHPGVSQGLPEVPHHDDSCTVEEVLPQQ